MRYIKSQDKLYLSSESVSTDDVCFLMCFQYNH